MWRQMFEMMAVGDLLDLTKPVLGLMPSGQGLPHPPQVSAEKKSLSCNVRVGITVHFPVISPGDQFVVDNGLAPGVETSPGLGNLCNPPRVL